MKLHSYTDGGARGNPGPAAIGVVLKDEAGKTVHGFGRYIGETTNNQAEYRALISALENALELKATDVICHLDSELVVKQMKGEYRVKDIGLRPLYQTAFLLAQKFKSISYTHIPREQNEEADWHVNEALDKEAG